MDPRLVTPYLVAALIVWGLYRRMRRSFGRQRVTEGRMWVRIGILTVIAVMAAVGTAAAHDLEVLGGLVAGIACGAALGYVGLRHTKFEVTAEGRYYTPHTYMGLAVTALFVGRVIYRFLSVYDGTLPAGAAARGFGAYQANPFTLAALGVLVGYYVLYYLGVLQRTRLASAPVTPFPRT
jgi:xanthine/uracil permease